MNKPRKLPRNESKVNMTATSKWQTFGEISDDQITQLIAIRAKDDIYLKEKKVETCYLEILKDLYFKNLNITRLHDSIVKYVDMLERKWKSFKDILRKDNDTHKS